MESNNKYKAEILNYCDKLNPARILIHQVTEISTGFSLPICIKNNQVASC